MSENNKEIMLFSGNNYYPCGGWEDFKGYFDSVESAIKFLKESEPEHGMWCHLVENNKIIIGGTSSSYFDQRTRIWTFEKTNEL